MKSGAWALSGAALLMTMARAGAASATSPEFDKCVDKSGGVTIAMRNCASAEEDRQDRDLNAFYKQAMARRDAAGRDELRTQERAWLNVWTGCVSQLTTFWRSEVASMYPAYWSARGPWP